MKTLITKINNHFSGGEERKPSPKAPSPPKPIAVEDSDDTETTTPAKSESSEKEGSKQIESTQPGSEKAESEESKAENTESGKFNFEELSSETPLTKNQAKKEPSIRGTLIKCKNLEVRESARWKIPEAEDIFLKGLIRTKRRSTRWLVFPEKRVIIMGLPGYPAVEKKFRDYGLGCTAKGGYPFCPTVVQEFYVK